MGFFVHIFFLESLFVGVTGIEVMAIYAVYLVHGSMGLRVFCIAYLSLTSNMSSASDVNFPAIM
jgi:hypothetical protein